MRFTLDSNQHLYILQFFHSHLVMKCTSKYMQYSTAMIWSNNNYIVNKTIAIACKNAPNHVLNIQSLQLVEKTLQLFRKNFLLFIVYHNSNFNVPGFFCIYIYIYMYIYIIRKFSYINLSFVYHISIIEQKSYDLLWNTS